jgi:hypothetical protein
MMSQPEAVDDAEGHCRAGNRLVIVARSGGCLRIRILDRMTAMLRVSERTRDRVMQVASEDFGGATAEETLIRLLDEHWEAQAIAAMDRFRATDPDGWAEYLAEAGRADTAQAAVVDTWDEYGSA